MVNFLIGQVGGATDLAQPLTSADVNKVALAPAAGPLCEQVPGLHMFSQHPTY